MDSEKLVEIIEETTKVYRKGPLVETRRKGNVEVTEIFGYPPASSAPKSSEFEKVDMLFIEVVVDKSSAEARRAELESLLKDYPDPQRLAGGPSYIELAPNLGVEQETALRLMALGSSLGMWSIINAKTTFHMSDGKALEMAGTGFLMISGWDPDKKRNRAEAV